MQLRELLWSRKRGFLLYLFGSLLTIASSITGHLVVALMVGQVTREEGLFTVFVVAGLLTLGSPMLQVISRFLRTAYMRDTLYDIRRLAFKKVLGQSYQRFASQSHSTYISRLVNDINLFEKDFFVSFLNVIVTSGIYIVVWGSFF
ncbi:MAG: ABC transporter ATP-binding protein [Clostridiaceae bacterium]|nr:ABC transporter ATP-binding protein [Clostridiaceae bacterium]